MDLNLNSEDLAFRDEVRAFLKDKLDPKVAEKVARSEAISKDEILAWQKALYEQGWIVPNWPVAYLLQRGLVVPRLLRAGLGVCPRLATDPRRA